MKGEVNVLDEPVDDTDYAAEETVCDGPTQIALLSFLRLGDADGLTDHVDERNDQGAEADTAERVGQRTAQSASSGACGHISRAEEPRAIYAGDDGVYRIFQPFRDPVAGEGDEHQQTDDFSAGAIASAGGIVATARGAGGLVFDVHGD